MHPNEDETFYLLAGELEFLNGDQTFTAVAGDLVHIPRGTRHRFRKRRQAHRADDLSVHPRRGRAGVPGPRSGGAGR
ncbi:cupin domain-containing protein [Phytohabitans aurantiacus]